MMILIQNEQAIVNTENLNYIEIQLMDLSYKQYEYGIIAVFNNVQKILGKYKTEKRANEILQDMYKQILIQNFNFTYEMPKE